MFPINILDTKELKVLVDLAMITAAGQGDMEEEKVSSFHSAILGYAPLIYHLKPNSSLDEFLNSCRAVWRALKSDESLPKKLVR